MPFIRYATGDLATRGEDRCPCGRAFPALAAIVGRLDDVVVTPDGREIGRLDPVFKGSSGLMEARIVQDRADHLRIEAVVTDGWSAAEEARLRSELAHRVGAGMTVDVVTVRRIERGPGGKLRGVVNELRPRGRNDAAGTRSGAGRV
jgi:phenylacetate-CoA ligase